MTKLVDDKRVEMCTVFVMIRAYALISTLHSFYHSSDHPNVITRVCEISSEATCPAEQVGKTSLSPVQRVPCLTKM